MLKNYNPNFRRGKHTVEITLQQWGYRGTLSYKMRGNAKGASILDTSFMAERIADLAERKQFHTNDCKFKLHDDWFTAILVSPDGEELMVEDELTSLEDMIVGVNIIDFVKEEEVNEYGETHSEQVEWEDSFNEYLENE